MKSLKCSGCHVFNSIMQFYPPDCHPCVYPHLTTLPILSSRRASPPVGQYPFSVPLRIGGWVGLEKKNDGRGQRAWRSVHICEVLFEWISFSRVKTSRELHCDELGKSGEPGSTARHHECGLYSRLLLHDGAVCRQQIWSLHTEDRQKLPDVCVRFTSFIWSLSVTLVAR